MVVPPFVAHPRPERKRRVECNGYKLLYVEVGGEVVVAAGYRIAEWLAWGRSLYVDGLITSSIMTVER